MPRISGDVASRILRAGLKLLASQGPRAIKSSAVATEAETSESSLFRYYDDMPDLLSGIYDNCWDRINKAVNDPAEPSWGAPGDVIERTFEKIWAMASDADSTDTLFVAFTYYRRPRALGGNKTSENQSIFEQRLSKLCAAHLSTNDDKSAQTLQMILANFASTVVLSWIFRSPDVPELTREEATIGIRSLLSGFYLQGPGQRMANQTTTHAV